MAKVEIARDILYFSIAHDVNRLDIRPDEPEHQPSLLLNLFFTVKKIRFMHISVEDVNKIRIAKTGPAKIFGNTEERKNVLSDAELIQFFDKAWSQFLEKAIPSKAVYNTEEILTKLSKVHAKYFDPEREHRIFLLDHTEFVVELQLIKAGEYSLTQLWQVVPVRKSIEANNATESIQSAEMSSYPHKSTFETNMIESSLIELEQMMETYLSKRIPQVSDVQRDNNRRMALLIDGDNAQPSLIVNILAEASKYGNVTIRRIYGDWTTSNMNGWKDSLASYAIQPIQQFRYTTGKNSTDSALIIDAMDVLYSGHVEGFCIVSSDSDYTRLATRIREKGFFVLGIGRKDTPKAFANACNIFVYTENISGEKSQKDQTQSQNVTKQIISLSLRALFKKAFEASVQDDGWAFLGVLGSKLQQLDPSFDVRTYGCSQLSALVKKYSNIFEVNERGKGRIYVKLKI